MMERKINAMMICNSTLYLCFLLLGLVEKSQQFIFPYVHSVPPQRISYAPISSKKGSTILSVDDMNSLRTQMVNVVPLSEDSLLPMVKAAVKSADDRKAASISAVRVSHLTEVTQFIVMIEGNNNRQIQAITDSIEDDLYSSFQEVPYVKEGTAASGWFVLDYGSILVHVMTPAMKNYYKLEKRWAQGEAVDLTDIIGNHSIVDNRSNANNNLLVGGHSHSTASVAGVSKDILNPRNHHHKSIQLSEVDQAFWGSEDEALSALAQMSKQSKQSLKSERDRKKNKAQSTLDPAEMTGFLPNKNKSGNLFKSILKSGITSERRTNTRRIRPEKTEDVKGVGLGIAMKKVKQVGNPNTNCNKIATN